MPIRREGGPPLVLEAGRSYTSLEESLNTIGTAIAAAIGVAFLLSIGEAYLEVSDTGAGIPEEELPLVFERFYRLDSSRTQGGAGLGLSIAKQIAEAHGGAIDVESTEGRGSTFKLLLRRKPAAPG